MLQYVCGDTLQYGPGVVMFGCRLKYETTGTTFDQIVDPVFNTAKTTVTRNGVGDYTVKLPKVGGGWPQELITMFQPHVVAKDAADAGVDEAWKAQYVMDSYSKTAGTFQILVFKVTGATVTAAADLTDEAEIHIQAMFRNAPEGAQTF